MGKFCSQAVFDAGLNKIGTATREVGLSGQPATYAAANSGALVASPMATADFTLAAGAIGAGSRQTTVAEKDGLAVITPGTVDHIALLDDTNSILLYVTTCPAQAIVAGGTVNLGSWAIEIDQPT